MGFTRTRRASNRSNHRRFLLGTIIIIIDIAKNENYYQII